MRRTPPCERGDDIAEEGEREVVHEQQCVAEGSDGQEQDEEDARDDEDASSESMRLAACSLSN